MNPPFVDVNKRSVLFFPPIRSAMEIEDPECHTIPTSKSALIVSNYTHSCLNNQVESRIIMEKGKCMLRMDITTSGRKYKQ